MKIIYPQNNTETILQNIDCSLSILQTLWLNSFYNNKALCSGVGKCGKCKILFLSKPPKPSKDEEHILSEQEIDMGIRLACKHNANPTYIIELLDNFPYSNKEERQDFLAYSENYLESEHFKQRNEKKISLCLAVDFGTTTMEYELFADNIVYASGKQLNPMQGIGAEVMARLEFAKNKEQAHYLKEKSLESLKKIVKKAFELGFIVEKIIFSANSAMTYLAFGFESSSLASSPYNLDYKGDSFLDFENLPPIYVPPLLAPFVGGDISSGLFALNIEKKLNYPYLFVDMGTNAEFILALSEEEALMASVPLGPSVEGIGLTFGTVAQASSIVDFAITPMGIIPENLDKNIQESSGICGVAYLNLLSALKKLSLLDKSGHFSVQDTIPLGKKIAQIFLNKGEECLKINKRFYLSSSDIERILMVKSAFRTAYELLLQEATNLKQVDFLQNSIKNIYIAGSFGKYIKQETLIELGFLPNIPKINIEQVGNTSLLGAKLLCQSLNQDKTLKTDRNNKQDDLDKSKTNKFDKNKECKTGRLHMPDCSLDSVYNTIKKQKKHFKNFTHIELANHKDFATYYMKHFSLSD